MDQCNKSTPSVSKPFIETVSGMIGLLLDYHNVENDDTCKGRRMGCMFNLLVSGGREEKEEVGRRGGERERGGREEKEGERGRSQDEAVVGERR